MRSSFSIAAVGITAFFALVVMPRATIPLVDGDVWWHLRAGQEVIHTGRVPNIDHWSIAGAGMPWISQDWLANVGMAFLINVNDVWGATLLSLGFGIAVAGAFACLWVALRTRGDAPGWLTRVLWLTVGLVVAGPVIGVRVQTLDLVLAAAAVWLLWSYLADPRTRWLIGLPVLATLWVNTHAGYPLLFLLGGSVVVGEALDRSTKRRTDAPPLEWRFIARLVGALAVSAAFLLVNPNGAAILTYPFQTASIGAHRDFIFEWSRPDLSSFPGQVLFIFVIGAVVPTLWFARHRIRSADALWLVGLTIMSFIAIRFVLVLGPIGAAIVAVNLTASVGRLRAVTEAAVWTRMARQPSTPMAFVNAFLCGVVVVAGAAISLTRSEPSTQRAAIAESMPVEATAWLATQPGSYRIFNVYAWGGYIGRELPDSLVYIDGRSDIYGDAPIREYAAAIALERNPFELLDREAIDVVVFWPDSAFAKALERHRSWRRVYDDPRAAIWFRETDG